MRPPRLPLAPLALALLLAPAALAAQREVPRLRPAPPPTDVPAGWTAPPPAPPDTRERLLESLRREPGRARLPASGASGTGVRAERVGGQVRAPAQSMTGSADWPLTVTPAAVSNHIAGQPSSGPRDRITLRLYGAEYRSPNAIILRHYDMSMFGFQLANAYAELEVEVREAGYYVVSATGATQNAQIRLDVFAEQFGGTPGPAAQPSWNPGQHTLETWSGQTGTKQLPALVELQPGTYRFRYIVRGGSMQFQQASVMPL